MSKIEWCDVSWSPVTGCWGPGGTEERPQICSYCFARRMALRLQRMPQGAHKYRNGFEPTFHREELERPARWKKPRRIFVCSMGDLFGEWVPDLWVHEVLEVAIENQRHTFMFLTKNPRGLSIWRWPNNAWVGATATDQDSATEAIRSFRDVDAPVRFLSCEPLLGPITLGRAVPVDWIIIGRQTGPGARRAPFDPAWVTSLTEEARELGLPVFHKDNLRELATIQDFPATRPKQLGHLLDGVEHREYPEVGQ